VAPGQHTLGGPAVQLENSFTVPVPIDEAWRVLMDIERIAPCMPGAALDSVTGDDFTGRVKVKLGPINLTYQGKASFIERDETGHRAVIDARGKDQRGNGTAAAVVTATLASEGSVTRVDVLTDLNITGRPAQFGRGVMTDVGNKLLGQFADKLSAQLASGDAGLVDDDAAAQSQEPTVASTVTAAAAKAAATTAGVVEEVAASVEGSTAAEPAKGAAAAAKKTAAAAADTAATAEKSAVTAPIKAAKAAPATAAAPVPDPTIPPAKAAPAAQETTPAAADTAPAAADSAPAATPITAKNAPSKPPTGTTAPPNRPAGGGPAKSTPAAARRSLTPVEPEPIDLLEVAGGAALTRYAAPAAGAAAVVLLIALIVRRRRKH
jgi:carbon monoxide dehydrogenase subunit G